MAGKGMTRGFTSVGKVISKLYRDLRLNDPQFELDAIEWIGEALAHIGTGISFTETGSYIRIEGYKGELPHNLFRMIEVFEVNQKDEDADIPTLDKSVKTPLSHNASTLPPNLTESGLNCSTETFVTQGKFVHTSFEEGWLFITYDAIDVDEDGYPIIPNDPEFHNAFIWYIMRQMMMGGWQHPNKDIGFERADQMWQRYCRQARVKAMIPSIAEYESFKDHWVNMIPMENRRAASFQNSSSQSDGYYGRVFYQNELR